MKDESSTSGGGGVSTTATAPSPSGLKKRSQPDPTISSSSSSSSTCSGGSKSSSPSWSSSLESSNGGSSGSSSKSGSGGSTSPVTGVLDHDDEAMGGRPPMREVILQKLMAAPLDNEDDLVDFAQWVTTMVGKRLSRKRLVHPDEAAVETTNAMKRLKTSSSAAAACAAGASSSASSSSSSSPSSSSSSSSSSSHSHSKAHEGDGRTAAIENNHNGTGSPRFYRTMTTGGPGAGGGFKRTASPTLNHQGSALDRDRDTEVINILLEFSNKASKAKHDYGDDMQTSDSNRPSPRRNNHHHHHKHHHTHHHCHHGPTQKVAAAGVPLFKNLSMNGYHKASSGPPLLARTHSEAERLPSHDACDHPMSVSSLSSGHDQSPPESSTTTSGSTAKGSGFSSSSSCSSPSSSSGLKVDGHSSSSGGNTSQECSSNSSKDKDSSSSGNGNSSDSSSNSDGGDGGSSSSQSDVCSSSSRSGSSKGGHTSSSSNNNSHNGTPTAPVPVVITCNERERERDRHHHHHHHRLREGVMPPLPPLPLTRSTGSVIPDPSMPPAIKPHTLHKGEEGSTITVDVDGRFLGVIVAKISKHYIYYMERGSPFKEGRPAGKWTYFYGASEKGSGRKHLFAGQRFRFSADPNDKRIIAGVVRYNKDTARNAALMYDATQSEFYLMSIAGIQRSAVEEFLEDPAEINELRDKTIRWITSPARDKDSFPRFASRAQTSTSSPSTNGASSNGNGEKHHGNGTSIGSTSSSGSSTASSSPLHGSSGRSRPSAATNEGLRVRSLSTSAIPLVGGQVPHGPPQYPAMPPTSLLHHGSAMGLLGLEEAAYLHGPPGTPYMYDYHHAARMAMRPIVAREVDMDGQDAYHSHASLALAAGGAAPNQAIHGSSSFPSAKASAGQPHYRIPVGLVNGHATAIPVPSSSGIPNSAANMPPSSSAPVTTEPAYAAAHPAIPTLAYHPGAWMGPHIPLPSSLYAPRTHSAMSMRHNLQTRGWQAEAANKSTGMPPARKGQSATSMFPS